MVETKVGDLSGIHSKIATCVVCVAGTSTFGTNACGYLKTPKDPGGSSHLVTRKPDSSARSLFRISVRITGPRNTETYIQTTAG